MQSYAIIEQESECLRKFNNACSSDNLHKRLRAYEYAKADTAKESIRAALDLIMFYHNHRRYKSGKRKDKAPIEILTGQTLDKYWVQLLADTLATEQAA